MNATRLCFALLVACAPPAAEKVRVTIAGEHVSVAPRGYRDLDPGGTLSLTVTPDPSYTRVMDVGGDCPIGAWVAEVYTTAAITEDCAVSFSATINHYEVTATASHATVTPAARTVEAFTAASFSVTADAGYTLSLLTTTTCPTGLWASDVYSTGPVTFPCSVAFRAGANLTVTASGGTVDPAMASAFPGTTAQFTFTPTAGFSRNDTVGGTCPAGSWDGDIYTTGAISEPCTLVFLAVP